MAASLALAALVSATSSAFAGLSVTTANSSGTANVWPFTPTFTVVTNGSLIAGMTPIATAGNFNLESPTNGARNVSSLTTNTDLTLSKTYFNATSGTTASNYVTCGNGSGAGWMITYSLPATANGYNLTNITLYGGWADRGRDALAFTVLYATAASPTNFIVLTNVQYNPSIAANTPSANQAIINDDAGGAIAANVAAIKFIFAVPTVENGYAGVAAITVGGTPASSVATPALQVSTTTETGTSPLTPTFTAEAPSLIATLAPSSSFGNFTLETSGGTPVLTDGLIGTSGTVGTFATCGGGGGSGSSLIYTLPNIVNGSDVTNIVVYSGWGDGGRDGQYYTVSYSTVAAPATFIPITTVYYNPIGTSGAVANRVAISKNDGSPLGSAVANVRFDFSGPPSAGSFDNGYQGYSEIIIQGHDTPTPPPPPSALLVQDTLPAYMETTVGDQVIFTTTFSNVPPVSLQWQQVVSSPAATNNINTGVVTVTNGELVTSTLTLNSAQLTSAGAYRVKADNATNSAAATSFSYASPLVINTNPLPVNNIIALNAAQSGQGALSLVNQSTNFFPTWVIDTNNDLILGFPTDGSGNPGTAAAGPGSFGLGGANGDPTILADGDAGYINYWPNVGSSPTMVTCGSSAASPGSYMIYTLNTNVSPNGFDLTSITIYGGWGDSGRNEQKYQILYSTIASPGSFINMGTFDYNPNNPGANQSATRVTLVPASGAMAQNVYAVQINWALQGSPPKNGYEGYSEIIVKGTHSSPKPVLTNDVILTADDVVGSSLVLSAGFSGATSYQWQKNGTNVQGATAATLVLNNLQLSDTATNGGYRLVAVNGAGSSTTRECAVTVNPAPAAVSNVVIAFAHQTSDAGTFTPTWDTSSFSSSLINGAFPDFYGTGNFNDPDINPISNGLAGGLPSLTDSGYGSIVTGGPHPAFATCGPNAGQFVTYVLPASSYGYTLTNLLIASGWNDGGRDDDWATISYSTVANPTTFIPLAVVTNSPVVNNESVIRATVTPATGVLAENVYAIQFDFTRPPGVENGYVGISQINVFGQPSVANTIPITVSGANENPAIGTAPSWVIETPNLIAGALPSTNGPGAFAGSFNGEPVCGGLPALTDGAFGVADNTLSYATCGNFGAGPWVTYTCTNGAWNLTNIVVYSGWGNYDRDGQFYTIYYTTAMDPATRIPLQTVTYNPQALTGPSANRVAITPVNGILATNVHSVTFDFTVQGTYDNGYSGYAEIVLQGDTVPAVAPTTPPVVNPPTLSGGNMIVTGSGGTPGKSYNWLMTTNLVAPVIWTTNSTGVLDSSGSFSNAFPIIPSQPAAFFRLQMP